MWPTTRAKCLPDPQQKQQQQLLVVDCRTVFIYTIDSTATYGTFKISMEMSKNGLFHWYELCTESDSA